MYKRQEKDRSYPRQPAILLPLASGKDRCGYAIHTYRISQYTKAQSYSFIVQYVHQRQTIQYPYRDPLSLCEAGTVFHDTKGAYARVALHGNVNYEPVLSEGT